jgi:hypothetical protein
MKRTPDDPHSAADPLEAAREPAPSSGRCRAARLSACSAPSASRPARLAASSSRAPPAARRAGRARSDNQYPLHCAPGRAVAAAKKLRAYGKAPNTLIVGKQAGAVGSYTHPFRKVAKSAAQVWEDETGISLKFVGVDPAQTHAHNTRLAATNEGSEYIVPLAISDIADHSQAGLLLDPSEFVARYKPDWSHPRRGYVGAAKTSAALQLLQPQAVRRRARQRHPARDHGHAEEHRVRLERGDEQARPPAAGGCLAGV